MSITTLTYVYCDAEDCPRKLSEENMPSRNDPVPDSTVTEVRNDAVHSFGWRKVGREDYCPECARRLWPSDYCD